jgi:hypothetical protein
VRARSNAGRWCIDGFDRWDVATARRLMANGIHLKRIEADDFAHGLIYFPLFSSAC